MIKYDIKYRNFDDNERTKTVYFHMTRTELGDNLDLGERFETLAHQLAGDGTDRELTKEEVKIILELVKDVMKLSYGERSADGEHFYKSEAIWHEFKSSAVYDAALWWLFEDSDRAMGFLTGMMPKDLVEEAKAQQRKQPQDHQPKAVETVKSEVLESSVEPEKEDELAAARRRLAELEAQRSSD